MGTRAPAVTPSRAFWVVAALLFAGSVALTYAWCASMSDMPGMEMPGGWRMSMTWMRMPGQSWPGAAAAFLGMWMAMTIAMMTPALLPIMWRYRVADSRCGCRSGGRVLAVAAGYLCVWLLAGLVAYLVGASLAAAEMRSALLSQAAPWAAAVLMMLAGALQLTRWKQRELACCRRGGAPGARRPADLATALRRGVQLGWSCCRCCAPLTVLMLCAGMMDLRVLALVSAATSAERLLPAGARLARITGWAAMAAGFFALP